MLAKPSADYTEIATIRRKPGAGAFFGKKIWIPKLLYDALPYFYLTAGFTAFFATLYISEWFWVLPHYVLFAAACMHLAVTVHRRRRRGEDH